MINDKMINCKTKLVVPINDNLLDCDFWEKDYSSVVDMLKNIVNQTYQNELSFVSRIYLQLFNGTMSNPRQLPREKNNFILILGKCLNDNASMKETLINRLETALSLYKENKDIKIITSGNGEKFGITESQAMKDWLVEKGVSEKSIFLETKSVDTVQNITLSSDILVKNKATEVTLVTSEDHMFRAFNLLSVYNDEKKLNFNIKKCISKKSDIDGYFNQEKENFVLFKDIGRMLNLWEYKDDILIDTKKKIISL